MAWEFFTELEYQAEPDRIDAFVRDEVEPLDYVLGSQWNIADARVPDHQMLGGRGEAFAVAQVRLSGGRMHHAMRTFGQATRAFEMMCQRALSRFTKGGQLAQKQMVQENIADSWVELRQFRLLILETAWLADQSKHWKTVRKNAATVKTIMPKVLHDISARALQIHGALGITHDIPFVAHVIDSLRVGLADGPTEVHKITVAREALKDFRPANSPFPSYMAERLEDAARLPKSGESR